MPVQDLTHPWTGRRFPTRIGQAASVALLLLVLVIVISPALAIWP